MRKGGKRAGQWERAKNSTAKIRGSIHQRTLCTLETSLLQELADVEDLSWLDGKGNIGSGVKIGVV